MVLGQFFDGFIHLKPQNLQWTVPCKLKHMQPHTNIHINTHNNNNKALEDN